MTYVLKHDVSKKLPVRVKIEGGNATVSCAVSGKFSIRFPGKLLMRKYANYRIRRYVEDVGVETEGGRPPRGKWHVEDKKLPLTLEISTPDGKPFTADKVTRGDLNRFRDLRGATQGEWTYKISGKSEPIPVDEETRVTGSIGGLHISVEETVTSKSAPAFVSDTLNDGSARRYTFDLYRVGTFTATARSAPLPPPFIAGQPRTMNLVDPNGAVMASSDSGELQFPVTLQTLDKSRDAEGKPRPWTLDVLPATSITGPTTISATVVETARIHVSALQSRIDFLIGPEGEKLSIYGEMKDKKMIGRLAINDAQSAGTIDMHELLDDVILDPDPDGIHPHKAYTIAEENGDLDYGINLVLDELKVSKIEVRIGASEKIQPPTPALKVRIRVTGHLTAKIGSFKFATVEIRDDRIDFEAGLALEAGTFTGVHWIEEDRVDADVHWGAAIAAGVVSAGLLTLGAVYASELIEGKVNKLIQDGFARIIDGVAGRMPHMMAVILGDDFTYRAIRLVGDDIAFDYEAPFEPDPKPAKNYIAIVGRSATQVGPRAWHMRPPLLPDSWPCPNLTDKIDHIVVVMMENRSYDHVLGYRAQLAGYEDEAGLSAAVIETLEDNGFIVPKLNGSKIKPNEEDYKTKFPVHVGHGLADVTEQLSKQVAGLNSPEGFKTNFEPRYEEYLEYCKKVEIEPEVTLDDVIGYYEADDLPFFKFLVEHYAYCERFYCSHAGPTLPNRMFSLTGDVQYDRSGEAVLDNNNGDNFYLSRAMTIFDVLERKRVPWRVYESPPSVTMLRMFARYSTDETNVVPIDRLKQDVAKYKEQSDFPAVTVIEPAMHHYPPNDDHPIADMYRGQVFLKDVYDTLRSNETLWRKTMLIITYDEHGGFYDHVVPPLAEALYRDAVHSDPGFPTGGGGGPTTPDSMAIPYGVRVPTFVVSPWTTKGTGPDVTFDHCSILKTILARFCGQDKPFMSNRVSAARSFEAYLSEAEPRLDVPPSPDMAPLPVERRARGAGIVTDPLFRRDMRGGNVDSHNLMGMIARLLGR